MRLLCAEDYPMIYQKGWWSKGTVAVSARTSWRKIKEPRVIAKDNQNSTRFSMPVGDLLSDNTNGK